jgi:ADP-L-glycero-D-manno-heptose 6-epimerase
MASVAFHFFNQFQTEGRVKLFQGWDGYADGEQRRDFVSIEDVVAVNLYFLERPGLSGIFNLGTGRAQSFNEVAVATINALRAEGTAMLTLDEMRARNMIEYIAFPDALKGKYQSHTEADISMLRETGYEHPFLAVDEGVARYCEHLLGLDR